MESQNELEKMQKYLDYTFSCAHCKHLTRRKCSITHGERIENNYLLRHNMGHWCIGWTKPENWVNKKRKL